VSVVEKTPAEQATSSSAQSLVPDPMSEDELPDAALEAVVGGLTTQAALARAVAFDQTQRLPAG
jgi:hypothetical protein